MRTAVLTISTSVSRRESEDESGPHLGFCTGHNGQVELDVEARGLGLSWLFFLFQVGPARPEAP